jgi:hypothetical protein
MNEADVCALPKIRDTRARRKLEPPATYAVLWNRGAAAEALNERRIELGMSLLELDEAADQAAGTAAKYLGPGEVKCLGVESFFRLAGALGLRIVAEVDHGATTALLEQSRPREASQARPGNYAAPVSERVVQRALRHLTTCYSWNEILQTVSKARAAARNAE